MNNSPTKGEGWEISLLAGVSAACFSTSNSVTKGRNIMAGYII